MFECVPEVLDTEFLGLARRVGECPVAQMASLGFEYHGIGRRCP